MVVVPDRKNLNQSLVGGGEVEEVREMGVRVRETSWRVSEKSSPRSRNNNETTKERRTYYASSAVLWSLCE